MNNDIARLLLLSLSMINTLDEIIRNNNLQNEQWFINWLDELNKISVK